MIFHRIVCIDSHVPLTDYGMDDFSDCSPCSLSLVALLLARHAITARPCRQRCTSNPPQIRFFDQLPHPVSALKPKQLRAHLREEIVPLIQDLHLGRFERLVIRDRVFGLQGRFACTTRMTRSVRDITIDYCMTRGRRNKLDETYQVRRSHPFQQRCCNSPQVRTSPSWPSRQTRCP
jgi:hypothetical protein